MEQNNAVTSVAATGPSCVAESEPSGSAEWAERPADEAGAGAEAEVPTHAQGQAGSVETERPAGQDAGAYRLGRDRRYLTWLTSDVATGLSAALASFAIPLIALAVTGSPSQAGIIGAAGMITRLATMLVGGVLADRHDRLRMMVWGAAAGLALAVLFAVLAAADMFAFGSLIVVNMLLALRAGVFNVAGEAALKDIVPAEGIGRAQAANQARDAALNLAGGPIGGALLAVGGWLVGAGMAMCQGIALVTALLLRHQVPIAAAVSRYEPDADLPAEAASSALAEAREGIGWLLRRVDLRGILIVSTVINLGFNAALTTVIYSLQMGGASPQVIGGLNAALGAVMLLGASAGPFLVTRVRAGLLALAGLALATLGIVLLPLVSTAPTIVAVLGGSVILLPALNAGLLGYMMVATPTELLGRVNSAAGFISMAAMPLAPLIAGLGLDLLGRTGTLLLAGAICVIAVGIALLTPSLRRIPTEADWAAHAEQFA